MKECIQKPLKGLPVFVELEFTCDGMSLKGCWDVRNVFQKAKAYD